MRQPKPNQVSAPQAYPTTVPSPNLSNPQPGGQVPLQPVAQPAQYAPIQQQNPPLGGQVSPQGQPPMQTQPQAQPQTTMPHSMPSQGTLPQHGNYTPQPQQPQEQMQQAAPVPMQQMAPSPAPNPMASGGYQAMPISMPEPESSKEGGEKALPRVSIHAFCERPETAKTVQSMNSDWRMARVNLKVFMGGLPASIEHYKSEGTPGLILFESSLQGQALFAQLEQLASVCDSGTKVVMVGATNDIKLFRELMEKGLSDYIVPPFHPLTLIRAIGELYADPDTPFVGRVVSFFGAKGGVGSSTLAHNMAWALAGKLDQETSLVDLDSSWGTTAIDFNYDSSQGLEEALSDPDRLDDTLLDRIMVRHSEKLSILPAAASLGSVPSMSTEAYEALITGIRSLSPLSIIDMPHMWTDWTSRVLINSDEIVITATPDLANLRNTKNLVDFLKTARPNDGEPILILNKTGVPKTAEIPPKDFAAAVGLNPTLVIGYDPVAFTEAANDGKMLCDINGGAAAFEGIMYLAHRLRTGEFPVEAKSKGGLGRPRKSKKGATKMDDTKKKAPSLFSKLKKRK